MQSLKRQFTQEEILDQLDVLLSDEDLNDQKIKKLMDAIVFLGIKSGFISKVIGLSTDDKQKKQENITGLLQVKDLNKLFDDQSVFAAWKAEVKKQVDAVKQEKDHQGKNQSSAPTSSNPKAHHKEKALGTITESDLLNKPNMTAEDKQKMQDTLDFMKSKAKLRTDENLKKLYDNVHYHHNAVEIAGRKWSRSYRESTKIGPNTLSYISDQGNSYKPRAFYEQETGLQYFNYEAALEEDKVMRKQGMYLPSKEDFEATLLALPGDYKEEKWYLGGNIFNLLLNGKENFTGYYNSSGVLYKASSNSYLWPVSPCDGDDAWYYGSDATRGKLGLFNSRVAFPLHPLVQ